MKSTDWNTYAHEWSHLQTIPFPQISTRPIVDLLIGMDYLDLHCSIQDVCGRPGEPVARLTPLGWTCIGTVGELDLTGFSGSYFTHGIESKFHGDDSELEKLVGKFWEVDSILTSSKNVNTEDQVVVDMVK